MNKKIALAINSWVWVHMGCAFALPIKCDFEHSNGAFSVKIFGSNRITELFELEGMFKGHLVQLPCNEQRHPQLSTSGAQSPIQPHPLAEGNMSGQAPCFASDWRISAVPSAPSFTADFALP